MADTLQSIFDLPDVSFIDNDTLDAMMQRMITRYESKYAELTGKTISLSPADPNRVLLYACALELYQIECYVDRAGKQDLLKYSYDEFLDALAANRGVTRQQPTAASTILRFTLSEVRPHAVPIPFGTRASNGDGVYFGTTEYAEVPVGSTYVDVPAECTELGVFGNGLVAGQLTVIVDPVGYVASVTNTVETSGGADLESDASLAERVFLAPSSYSTAGPDDAYIYWARTYNTSIGSVKPVSPPKTCEVYVYILMQDGTIPGETVIAGLEEFLRDTQIRPLSDYVKVLAPETKEFTVDVDYYINRSDASKAVSIQTQVEHAVSEYITWQTTEIGRDINPDELKKLMKIAGAKRVTIRSPEFTVVGETAVAHTSTTPSITYGGLEDD